ncbi:MAG: NAD-dependent protein deacetylase [Gammaproteobacteria bacterium]|nr:NAD-dependent protein deacetylase [Gammaproteobacteria bacterium]NVK87647.1 NAD-dependent protein deacetylase [Gammaproteobacteria bacterium]
MSEARHLSTFRQQLLSNGPWLVITGAGISAASGIPTYRDHQAKWLRSNPITHQAFLSSDTQRRRYWMRSYFGWPSVQLARPSPAHQALVVLEQNQLFTGLITQNVDRLHQQAGHQEVLDLHGRLDRVRCLQCDRFESREQVQQRLANLNSAYSDLNPPLNPDGDAAVNDALVTDFQIVSCIHCQGVLMPDVVFYGGTLAASTHQQAANYYAAAKALLIIGSSLMVYSAYRFCKQAAADQKPIVLLNQGCTRADGLATKLLRVDCQTFLPQLAASVQKQCAATNCDKLENSPYSD